MKNKLALFIIMLFAAAALTQELPKIAVYVTGNIGEDEKSVLGTRMLSALVNSGKYTAIERSEAFLAEIDREQVKQRSGAIDNDQISELGKQHGVKFVCIAAITPALDAFNVSARIVDVETAKVVAIGDSFSPLKTVSDLRKVSDEVVNILFLGQTAPKPAVPERLTAEERLLRLEHAEMEAEELAIKAKAEERARVEARVSMRQEERQEERAIMKQEQQERVDEYRKQQQEMLDNRKAKKYTVGAYINSYGDDGFSFEPYFRLKISDNMRIYMSAEIIIDNYYYDVEFDNYIKTEGSSDGYQFAGFIEWHLKNSGKSVAGNIYGGPGIALGYHSFLVEVGNVPNSDIVDFGIDIGVQGGAEVRFGGFLLGIKLRGGYYMRFWEDCDASGGFFTLGIGAGVTF